jgi:signal transduction histidine kinase
MQKEIYTLKTSNEVTVLDNLQETNMQFQILTEQLLEEKEKAEERERIKNMFFANMVHEIRTPMSAIKSFAGLLKSPDLTEENKVEYIDIIYQCTDNLLNLVQDLMDISKIEAGQLSIIEKLGNINDLFVELFKLFETPIKQHKSKTLQFDYQIELKQDEYEIKADFIRLRQILINLLSNALKFTEKGYVFFGCRLLNHDTLLFYVEDTGIGIAPENQAIVFERFQQINNTKLTTKCNGTGLGLSIVKSLVKLMGGMVWVESVEGMGATFYFTFPYKRVKPYNYDI